MATGGSTSAPTNNSYQELKRNVIPEVMEFYFKPYHTPVFFTSRGAFSRASIILEPYKDKAEMYDEVVRLRRLVDFETMEKMPEVLNESFERLLSTLSSRKFFLDKTRGASEKEVVINVAKKILIPLFGKVIFEHSYSSHIDGVEGADTDYLGFGSSDTWHGEPDLRVCGCDFVCTSEHLDGESDEDGDVEEAQYRVTPTVNVEGKRKFNSRRDMSQLVTTSVVSAFVENNIHPGSKHTLVPTILLNQAAFKVCMFDSKNDVLLVSQKWKFTNESGRVWPSAALLLWITVNYK